MFIHLPGNVAQLPFKTPSHMCCNCGCGTELHQVEVEFKHTRYFLLAGTELTFALTLPFCGNCASSANRYRKGWFSRALIAFGLFWVTLGVLMAVPLQYVPQVVQGNLAITAVIIACTSTFAYFASRKPAGPKTSVFQPVYLKGIAQSFRGEIKRMTFGFTNRAYSEAFRGANAALCDSGALIVRAT